MNKEIDKRNILPQLAVAVQPGVDPNSGQWPADGGNSTFSTNLHFWDTNFVFVRLMELRESILGFFF